MKITREIEINAAHRLEHHKGLCSNLHGHRYVIHATVSGNNDNVTGMVTVLNSTR